MDHTPNGQDRAGHLRGVSANPKNHPKPNSVGKGGGDTLEGQGRSTGYQPRRSANTADKGTAASVPDDRINRGYVDAKQQTGTTTNPGANRQRLGNR
jgi:hypothetical protein